MTSKTIVNGILRALAVIAGIALLLFILFKISSVLIYIAIASIMSLIARPVVLFLRRKLKFPNTLAVSLVLFLFIVLMLGILGLFVPLFIEQGQNLSLLETDTLESNLQTLITQTNEFLKSKNINILSQLKSEDVFSSLESFRSAINSVFQALGSFGIGLFSVVFIAFFFMKDTGLFRKSILTIMPKGTEEKFSHSIETINELLSRYFTGLVIQITILFVLYTIILLSFGIENAVVIAFLCALLNIIPYLGPIIAAILMTILCITSNLDQSFYSEVLPKTLGVMFFYLMAQLIDNFWSQPRIFSQATKAHPLEIFLVILVCGILLGPIGMIVAVPAYTVIKVILKEFLSENKIVKSITKDI